MFNDEGLGQAMAESHMRDRIAELERRLYTLAKSQVLLREAIEKLAEIIMAIAVLHTEEE